MKILLSAYACEPHKGSEPGVGWNLAMTIAQEHEVWVFTSNCHRAAIEAELAKHPHPRLHPIYCDPFGYSYNWYSGPFLFQADIYLHYYLWQIAAYYRAKQLHRQVKFDLIHHGTYGRYPSPSFLALLPVPFVWGPVGGGESAPKPFWRDFNWRDRSFELVREVARWCSELDPFVRLTARRAQLTVACTEETATRLRKIGAREITMVSGQTGVTQSEYEQLAVLPQQRLATDRPVRFLSMGRMLHWKGFHLGLKAFACANLAQAEYWIVGDGPYQPALRTLVEQLGLGDRVRFLGSLSRTEALAVMGDCDVLVHPSLHDFSPTVCVEAMAAGMPVLCLNLGGPGMQITDETGIRAKATNPATAIAEMTIAMERLANDGNLRQQLGQNGQARVEAGYRWENRGALFNQIYHQALGKTFDPNAAASPYHTSSSGKIGSAGSPSSSSGIRG
jgi:glycosyltransferase involved in cell wall biosynthesis